MPQSSSVIKDSTARDNFPGLEHLSLSHIDGDILKMTTHKDEKGYVDLIGCFLHIPS